MVSEGESQTGWAREFQSRGADLENALSPKVLSLDGGKVRVRGGSEGSGRAMGDKEVRQVGWGQVMECFEGQEEYFE